MREEREASSGSVFLLTDYGDTDEFAGVVRAVVQREAPGAPIVDLTHNVPAFDVRAGALTLARTVAHLGPGVVVAVVDPGVGTARRPVAVAAAGVRDRRRTGPRYFIGPDNGLLGWALDAVGGAAEAVEIASSSPPPSAARAGAASSFVPPASPAVPVSAVPVSAVPPSAVPASAVPASPAVRSSPASSSSTSPARVRGASFDGRDVFAPAAARLWRGEALTTLGPFVDTELLVRLPPPRLAVSAEVIEAEVLWVDRFGNVQLAAGPADRVRAGIGSSVEVRTGRSVHRAAVVEAFAELLHDDLGVMVDANGHLALVCNRQPAVTVLGVRAGDMVTLRTARAAGGGVPSSRPTSTPASPTA